MTPIRLRSFDQKAEMLGFEGDRRPLFEETAVEADDGIAGRR